MVTLMRNPVAWDPVLLGRDERQRNTDEALWEPLRREGSVTI